MSLIEAVITEITGTVVEGVGTEDRWYSVLCPFHDETNRSSGINPVLNCFSCRACPAKGNPITLWRQQKEVTLADAKREVERIAADSGEELQSTAPRKRPRPRISDWGTGSNHGNDKQVRPRFRFGA